METLRDLSVVRAVAVEVRATSGETARTMEVRFSPPNHWYEINSRYEGRFLERTTQGFLKRSIDRGLPGVKVLFNHGFDPQIGDKVLGPVRSIEDGADGPVAIVELLDTSYNRDLIPGLEAGVYGSSFRFEVIKDEWNDSPARSEHNPEGLPERTIKEARLMEFGPVTFPANPAATAGVRSATDTYYAQVLARDPHGVEDVLARALALRTPDMAPADQPVVDGPAAPVLTDPARSYSEDALRRMAIRSFTDWKNSA